MSGAVSAGGRVLAQNKDEGGITRAGWIMLLLIALLSMTPGLSSIPATDRDESRYAQASRQMLETGDLIDIRNQDEPRYVKPVGIYWMQVVTALPFGGEDAPIFAYRLPSLLTAILAVMATAFFAFYIPPLRTRGTGHRCGRPAGTGGPARVWRGCARSIAGGDIGRTNGAIRGQFLSARPRSGLPFLRRWQAWAGAASLQSQFFDDLGLTAPRRPAVRRARVVG